MIVKIVLVIDALLGVDEANTDQQKEWDVPRCIGDMTSRKMLTDTIIP